MVDWLLGSQACLEAYFIHILFCLQLNNLKKRVSNRLGYCFIGACIFHMPFSAMKSYERIYDAIGNTQFTIRTSHAMRHMSSQTAIRI